MQLWPSQALNWSLMSTLLFINIASVAVKLHDDCIVTAMAASVLSPNMSSCHLPLNFPHAETPYDCCAPAVAYTPRLFRPADASPSPSLRVRRPAHAANDGYAAALARAYSLMKALPADDPRSFHQQANIHCAYCNTVYNQMNSSQVFQVHNSWLFFPFHRWYLYFHERILAKLLGNDTFALAFWNYDHPDGASIPWPFSRASAYPILSTALRDPLHESPAATVAIDFNVDTNARPREVQLRENNNAMYRALIRDAATPENFFGWAYRHDDAPMQDFGFGTVEMQPHNSVHRWVGDRSAIGWKDMGSFYSAARDPIFYAHHAQIDRLWELWKTMPGHEEIKDEDYRNAEFVFYNEDGELVQVKAGDASNATMLGYVYEEVETPWMNATPDKRSVEPARLSADDDAMCSVGEAIVSTPCSIVVERDPEVSKASPWLHDHLVLTILFNSTQMQVDIYLNLPAANATTDTGCEEYLTDVRLFSGGSDDEVVGKKSTVRIDIRERLLALDLTEQSSLVVTLVPRTPPPPTFNENIVLLSAFVENTPPYHRVTTSTL